MDDESIHLPEPLADFSPVASLLQESLRELDALRAQYQARSDSGGIAANTLEAIRIELTYHSNAIEGNTLSLRDTQMVIEGRSPGADKALREIYEARNHDQALRMIEQWAQSRAASDAITDRDLLDIHARVLADIAPQSAGRLRAGRVLIAGTGVVPPGNQKFDLLLPRLFEQANRKNPHPAIQAAELHYNLVAVHPFDDGNGRTARVMMNYQLLRNGYPLTTIQVAERAAYLGALDDANAGRVEPFANLVISAIKRSINRQIGE